MGLHHILCVYAMGVSLVFCEIPNSGRRYVSDCFACSWDSFLAWVALSNLNLRTFALSYCILFFHIGLLSPGILFFFEVKQRVWDLDLCKKAGVSRGWEGLMEVDGGKNVNRIYCMRKGSIFKKIFSMQN